MLDAEGKEKLISGLKKLLEKIDQEEPFSEVKTAVRGVIDQYTGDGGNDVQTKLVRRGWENNWRLHQCVASGWFPRLSPG